MNQPEAATIWATVENSGHPEYGVVRIPFPIPRESYDSYIEQLQKMGLGDPLKQDCCVASVLSDYSILKKLEIMTVNVDELDYLAKRLESFDVGETVQFQAMAHKLELAELKDLIKGVSIEDELVQTMDALYQKHVPANVKSFLDMKTSSQKPKKKSSSSAVGDSPTEV